MTTTRMTNNDNDHDHDNSKGKVYYCLQQQILRKPRKLRNGDSLFVRYLMISFTFFALWFGIFDQQWSLLSLLKHDSSDETQSQQPSRNVNRNKTNNNKNSTNMIKIRPKILPQEDRSKDHLFVHIGKAGGSSILIMVKKSREKCKELMKNDDDDIMNKNETLALLKTQVCALATIPVGRVHLKERLHPKKYYSEYTQFFVNVRDPIDRLISWYNYEIVAFKKEPRWTTANQTGQAADNFRRLSQSCFPAGGDKIENRFAAMVQGGLLSSTNALSTESSSNSSSNNNNKSSCNELAQLCLRGDIMCFGHNYYNYEVYLEEILLRKGFSNDENNNNNNSENNDNNIRIDVIRSEHSVDDLNRTVGLWTLKNNDNDNNNNGKIEEFVGITPFVQSLYGRVRTIQQYDPMGNTKKKKKDYDGVLSSEASTALCTHICTELIVYKLILKASDNLFGSEIQDSYDTLDKRCGFRVNDVCGTSWTYRDMKSRKKVFDAPW